MVAAFKEDTSVTCSSSTPIDLSARWTYQNLYADTIMERLGLLGTSLSCAASGFQSGGHGVPRQPFFQNV